MDKLQVGNGVKVKGDERKYIVISLDGKDHATLKLENAPKDNKRLLVVNVGSITEVFPEPSPKPKPPQHD